jgi:hypothetical protein
MLWEAYYSLEPYGGELRYLAEIEAALLKIPKPILPPECALDQPLEDIDLDAQRKLNASALTGLAATALAEQGLDLDQMIIDAVKAGKLPPGEKKI